MARLFTRNVANGKPSKREAEFAVIGLGRFGSALARKLVLLGHTVLGIDSDPKQVEDIAAEIHDALILDASNEDALREADITAFDTVIVTIVDDFEASTLITISLKRLGVRRVIGVAHSDRHRDILLRLGADRVVQPLQEMGGRLADDLAASGVIQSMPVLPGQIIAEVVVQAGQTGQTIASCARSKLIVLAMVREGSLTTSPSAETVLREGDLLVLLGEEDRIDAFGRAA